MVCVYKEKMYKIFQDKNEYILLNSNNGKHTHIKEFKTCTYLIHLLLKIKCHIHLNQNIILIVYVY